MSILPSFLLTGILALLLGLAIIVWSAAFVQRRHGGLVLILAMLPLSVYAAYARDAVQHAEPLP